MIEPVLNECSVEPAAAPSLERVATLGSVLRKLDALGFARVLRQTRDALLREIEPGMSLRAWLFQRAPRDMRLFLGGRLERAPFVEDLHRQRLGVDDWRLEVTCDGAPAVGAGVAHFFDTPAVALRGVPRWEADPLVVRLVRVDDEGQLTELPVEVVHVSRPEQVEAREKMLRERVLRAVAGGADLWRRRTELFSRLDFCDAVERQVCGLSGNEFYFHHVVLALSRIDAALGQWTSGPFHPGMDSSAESPSTLAHSAYGPMRDFVCPDRQTRRFTNHLKLFANNWRIYYWEARSDEHGGRAIIGYIGAHLPTVKYRT